MIKIVLLRVLRCVSKKGTGNTHRFGNMYILKMKLKASNYFYYSVLCVFTR